MPRPLLVLFALAAFAFPGTSFEAAAQSPTPSANQQAASGSDAEQAGVRKVANGWLAMTDSGRTKDSFQALSSSTSARVEESKWQAAVAQAREEFGAPQGRRFKSMNLFLKASSGDAADFYLLEYRAVSIERGALREVVRMVKDDDGAWRVAGYTIAPQHQGLEDEGEEEE